MRIENRLYKVALSRNISWLEAIANWMSGALGAHDYPLRFAIVAVEEDEFAIEATILNYEADLQYAKKFQDIEILSPRKKVFQKFPFCVVQIVPTGVGCEIGGYAGDACPATNLLAATAEFVVTHPNAVNASDINEMAANVLYVEGKALDDFLLGHLGLMQVTSNKIGTFVDASGLDYLDCVVNTLNTGCAVKGIDCCMYMVSKEELAVKIEWAASGCAVGNVLHPESILDTVHQLIKTHGATAVGGVSVIRGVTQRMLAEHLQGKAPNPSGGVEAIITHLITKVFRVPTAHAPLPYYQDIKEKATFNPRASAEFISIPHYFSVLKGLASAPRLVPLSNLNAPPSHLITVNNVGAVVIPASCLGGTPALAAEFSEIPLIAVRDNKTVLSVTNKWMQMSNVIEVDSYLEAAGVVLALREGISLQSLRRPIDYARQVF